FGGKGVFEPDAEHIHHRMLRKGLTPRWVVVILYSEAALFGALSHLSMTGHSKVLGVVIILFSVGTWVGVQQLGYADLGALQWMLRHGLVHPGRREPRAFLAEAEPSASRRDPPPAGVLAARALS